MLKLSDEVLSAIYALIVVVFIRVLLPLVISNGLTGIRWRTPK